MSLRDDWKSVGKDFGKLGSDFGKSLVRSVKKGIDAVDKWADEDAQTSLNNKPATETNTEDN